MSKNIVFMPAIKIPGLEHRSIPYKYGINSWDHWCKKNNAELIIMDELMCPSEEMKITFQRYYAFDMLEASNIEYDQVLVTDADSIIHPNCPNFFNLTEGKYTVAQCDANYDWVCRSMENYAYEFEEFEEFDIWLYFCGGFQVWNKSHKPFIKSFIQFYLNNKEKILTTQKKYGVGTDQPIINHLAHKSNLELKYLPYQFCMVDLNLKGLLTESLPFTLIEGIYQFNAIPDNHDARWTNYFMEKTYKHLYEN